MPISEHDVFFKDGFEGSNNKVIRNKDSSNYLPGYTLTTGGFSRSSRCGQRPAKVNEGSHDSLM
jgi:hypothetical protein